jgi:hypothetical protein
LEEKNPFCDAALAEPTVMKQQADAQKPKFWSDDI